MSAEQAKETDAYTVGVQTVLWGMQWVKAGKTLRSLTSLIAPGSPRNLIDLTSHGINVWGHARTLLTHERRVIERRIARHGEGSELASCAERGLFPYDANVPTGKTDVSN